jgi:hypothetical protein
LEYIWENERWSLLRGWHHSNLLLGEKPRWSDHLGKIRDMVDFPTRPGKKISHFFLTFLRMGIFWEMASMF